MNNEALQRKKTIGGLSNTLGEEYRKKIAFSFALQLLNLSSKAYLQIEEEADDLRFFNGKTTYFIECKKHAPSGKWVTNDLRRKGVVDFFVKKYQENKNKNDFGVVLISSDGCKDLTHISDLARKGQIDLLAPNNFIKKLNLPQQIDTTDFFSHIYICTQSDFASKLLTGPIFNAAYESGLIDEIKRFIYEEGSRREKINLDILCKELSGVKNWILRKQLVGTEERESITIARFYRKSLSIGGVKTVLNELEKLYKTNPMDFYNEAHIHFIAYYTNFKLILGILNLFKNKLPINEQNARFLAANIAGNPLYQGHFFKKLEKVEWFSLLKDSLIKEICKYKEDWSVKFILLDYLRKILPQYQEDVITLLQLLRQNTSYYNILSDLVKTIALLQVDDDRVWNLLKELANHPHPWVRKEIPKTLKNSAEFNSDEAIGILKKLILYETAPVDVTLGVPTLMLTFQGRDNENHVFEEEMNALSYFLEKFPEKTFPLACKLLDFYIEKENKSYPQIGKIFDDHSYTWYSNTSSSRRKYESNRKIRLALEIEAGLKYLIKNNNEKIEKICSFLVDQKYGIFYLILLKALAGSKGLNNVKFGLVNNSDIWQIHGLREYYLQNFIKNTFESLKKKEIIVFVEKINKLKFKNKKEEKYIKCALFQAIPSQYQDKKIKKYLAKHGITNQRFQKPFQFTTGWVSDTEIKIEELRKKKFDEIIKIIKVYSKDTERVDLWDLGVGLENLAKEKPKIVIPILKKVKNKGINQELIGRLVAGFVKANTDNLGEIVKTFPFLRKKDNWAKRAIARALEEKYKEADKLPKSLLNKTNNILKELSLDVNPKLDRGLESDRPGDMDLLTIGINSIRGITAQAAIYYTFHYPKNKSFVKLIMELSKDRSLAVRACIISEMGYLIKKGLYDLTQEILKSFEHQRISGIDICIIRYLGFLNKEQLRRNKEWFKRLLTNSDEKIQKHTAELIGQRFIDGFEMDDLIEDIIKKRIGTKKALMSLAFIFESRLGKLYSLRNKKTTISQVMNYLKRLMDPSKEPDMEVREKASFLFERDTIKEDYLKDFRELGIFGIVGSDMYNIRAQSHAIHYLKKCKENYLNDTIIILSKIVKKESPILRDPLVVKDILEILKEGFKRQEKLDRNNYKTLEEIFDLVLETGWDEPSQLFYELLNYED